MGMSTHIIGLTTENDPTYRKMAAVLRACAEAGIERLPDEVARYFGHHWVDVGDLTTKREAKLPLTEWRAEMAEGFEIRVSEIPAGVEIIRFYNSW